MSAEGQRFGRSAEPEIVVVCAPRLTHAEQAHKCLIYPKGVNSISKGSSHLAKAAEIERVAREVVDLYFVPSSTRTIWAAMRRLRALVQPS